MPIHSPRTDDQSQGSDSAINQAVSVGAAFQIKPLTAASLRKTTTFRGKRSLSKSVKRGHYTRSVLAIGDYSDIAYDATLRAAAPQQNLRPHTDTAIVVTDDDMHKKVRVRKNANLIVFAVDASWSMAASARMEAAKGAVLSLLMDAYQKRDRVCMLVFQHDKAVMVLPPTNSVELAQRVLRDIPSGGKTPLSAGLLMAYEVIRREQQNASNLLPFLVLLTDGQGNVSITGLPPMEEAFAVADMLARAEVHSIVINTEHQAFDKGLAQQIANRLRGQYYTLDELKSDVLLHTIRQELGKSVNHTNTPG